MLPLLEVTTQMSKKFRHHYEDAYIFVPDEKQPDRYIRIPLNSEDSEHHHHQHDRDDDDSDGFGFGGFVAIVVLSILFAIVLA
jgi:hypothetical protein